MGLFCKKYNCSEDQLLLSWLLKHPSKIHPVIGTTKSDRIRLSSMVMDLEMETVDWFELMEKSIGRRVP